MADTEVGAKLVLDDGASATLDKMKGGFGGLSGKVKEVAGEMASFAKSALATAAGFQLSGLIDSFKELGHTIYEESMQLGAEQKELTATLQILDSTGASFESLQYRAKEYHEELTGPMALAAHQQQGKMVEIFSQIAFRTGRGAEDVKKLTGEFAQAGRAIPGGVDALTNGFTAMESGMIRARNPIIQLLKASGMVEGSAKEVAKSLSAMYQQDPSKVMDLAEKAISKMADKMKQMPPSMGELLTDLKELRGDIFEAAGVPILAAIKPQLDRLRTYFIENADTIGKWAKDVGEKAGKWVSEAADTIKEGFEFIQTHSEEIGNAIKEAWGFARSVVEFIIGHKEEIALLLGTRMAAQGMSAIGAAAPGLGAAAGAALSGGMGAFTTALAAAGPQIVLLTAALAAAAVAAEAWRASNEISEMQGGDKKHLEQLAKEGKTEQLQNMIDSMRELDDATSALEDPMGKMHTLMGMAKDDFEEYASVLASQSALVQKETAGLKEIADTAYVGGMFEDLAGVYNDAIRVGNLGAARYAAGLLVQSGFTAKSLEDAGIVLTGGMEAFGKNVLSNSGELADALAAFMGKGGGAGTVKAPKMNFSLSGGGAVTVNIKQDFRDQDPDRVMLLFRKDLQRAAQQRLQPVIGQADGL